MAEQSQDLGVSQDHAPSTCAGLPGERFIMSEFVGLNGHEWHLWEYNLDKPHMPDASDRRLHFAAKRLHGVYRNPADAAEAFAKAEGTQP